MVIISRILQLAITLLILTYLLFPTTIFAEYDGNRIIMLAILVMMNQSVRTSDER